MFVQVPETFQAVRGGEGGLVPRNLEDDMEVDKAAWCVVFSRPDKEEEGS